MTGYCQILFPKTLRENLVQLYKNCFKISTADHDRQLSIDYLYVKYVPASFECVNTIDCFLHRPFSYQRTVYGYFRAYSLQAAYTYQPSFFPKNKVSHQPT